MDATVTNVVKIVADVGSFGLVALFFVWLFMKGEPNYRETLKQMAASHSEAQVKLAESHAKSMTDASTAFQASMTKVCDSFQKVIEQKENSCRDERREDKAFLQKEMELNRQSRHEFANKLQEAIAEIHEANKLLIDAVQRRPRS